MYKQKLINELVDNKIVTIIRGLDKEKIFNTVEALAKGRIKFCEITFSQLGSPSDEETGEILYELSKRYDGKVHIGAGTVLNTRQVEIAKEAGAKYIISPDTNETVVRRTLELGMVSIPGAFTPTEISHAHNLGADLVKVFPCDLLPTEYFKAVSAPLPKVKLMATGGLNIHNIKSYLNSGVACCGIGSGIVNKRIISEGRYDDITDLAKSFVYTIMD